MWTFLLLILIESRPHAPWGWYAFWNSNPVVCIRNSYDYVRGYINETGLLAVIDGSLVKKVNNIEALWGFVEELQPYGFEYINLDEGWNQKDPWECDECDSQFLLEKIQKTHKQNNEMLSIF